MQAIILSGLVIFCSFTLEAITGFGCTVMALPFVTALLGMNDGVIILTVLALLLALYVAARNFKSINWKHFAIIVLLMTPGLFVGKTLRTAIDAGVLKLVLAIFIMVVSGFRLVSFVINRKKTAETTDKQVKWYSYVALLGAGVIHGMFASGGPLAIIYTTAALKDKNQFRATLCLLWTTLNIVLTATYLIDGSITPQIGKSLLCLIPFMIAGIVAGDIVHDKVNDKVFTLIVYISLFLTGVFMLV